MFKRRLHCNYFIDSEQGGRKYMEDFLLSSENDCAKLHGKSVYNHRLLVDCETTVFGVFDGHGGPEAAKFAQCNLLNEIMKQPGINSSDDQLVMKAIEAGFTSTSVKMWNDLDSWPKTASGRPSTAGTTASIVIIRDGKLYVAHVGDSTVVLGECQQLLKSSSESPACTAEVLTTDHKPSSPSERERIERSGGTVMEKNGVSRVVWHRQRIHNQGPVLRSTSFDSIPFLAVSRALGDLWSYNSHTAEYAVSPKPDIAVHKVDVDRHHFLILATDGLWNVVRPSEATAIVGRCISKIKEYHVAEEHVEDGYLFCPKCSRYHPFGYDGVMVLWSAKCFFSNSSRIVMDRLDRLYACCPRCLSSCQIQLFLKENDLMKVDASLLSKKSPATALIRLAMQRWSHHHVAADNISVIVVVFDDLVHDAVCASPVVSESSASDSGVDCSSDIKMPSLLIPVDCYSISRKLLGGDTCLTKRKLLLSNSMRKKRKVSSRFQIPTTSDQLKNFWSQRRSIGEIMLRSVLQSIDSNRVTNTDEADVIKSLAQERFSSEENRCT